MTNKKVLAESRSHGARGHHQTPAGLLVCVSYRHNEIAKGEDQTGRLLLLPSTDDHLRPTGAGLRTSSPTSQVPMHFDTHSAQQAVYVLKYVASNTQVDQTHANVRPRHTAAAVVYTRQRSPADARLRYMQQQRRQNQAP